MDPRIDIWADIWGLERQHMCKGSDRSLRVHMAPDAEIKLVEVTGIYIVFSVHLGRWQAHEVHEVHEVHEPRPRVS